MATKPSLEERLKKAAIEYVREGEIEKRIDRLRDEYKGPKTVGAIQKSEYHKDLAYLSRQLKKTEAEVLDDIFRKERQQYKQRRAAKKN